MSGEQLYTRYTVLCRIWQDTMYPAWHELSNDEQDTWKALASEIFA